MLSSWPARPALDSRAGALAWEEPRYAQLRRSGLRRRRVRDGALGADIAALIAGGFFAIHATGAGTVAPVAKPPSTLPVDSDGWDSGRPSMAALMAGDLTVTVRDGVACYRLGDMPVAWPVGFRAQAGTLAVLNSEGQVVAKPGQRVGFGGGGGRADVTTPCRAAGEWIDEVQDEHATSPQSLSPTHPGS